MTNMGKELGYERESGRSHWPVLCELLDAGEYEQAAELLRKIQRASQPSGNGAAVVILMAAQQICRVVSQCRAEIEWYRRAAKEATQRERQLEQELQSMLALLGGDVSGLFQTASGGLASVSSSETGSEMQQAAPPHLLPDQTTLGPARPSLRVYCLGPLRVYLNDEPITEWSGLKARSIFKYLVAHQGAPIAKDVLMETFWPEADPEAARRNLHQAIYSLRQTLKQGQPQLQPVHFENDRYRLDPELAIWLDYTEFETHVQAGQWLENNGRPQEAAAEFKMAIRYYQGDFLEEDLYEDWPMLQREYLRNMYLDVAVRLSDHYLQQGEYAAAIALCQKILTSDNCHEETHRRLMSCYVATDQRVLAVRQYRSCIQALQAELGMAPSAETQALYDQIANGGVREQVRAKMETVAS